MKLRKNTLTALVGAALIGSAAVAGAQQPGGMMGAPGTGAGPGMMGGAGGYGMGSGMMGGAGSYGMGTGMTGYGPMAGLALSDDQRAKIGKFQQDPQSKFAELGGRMTEQWAKLRGLYSAEAPDSTAILDAHKSMQELRREGLKDQLDARQKIEGVLTKEQHQQLRRWGPWWMMG